MLERVWSLEKFATPDNPYGMYLPGYSDSIEGKDPQTSVHTRCYTSYSDPDGIRTRRYDELPPQPGNVILHRIIGKTLGKNPGQLVENPHPYDDITITTLSDRGTITHAQGLNLVSKPQHKHITLDDPLWGKSERVICEGVNLETSFSDFQEVYRRRYTFEAVWGPTPADSYESSTLQRVEFTIAPTIMEIDNRDFPMEDIAAVNFSEADNFVADRGIERNLNDLKRILEEKRKNPDEFLQVLLEINMPNIQAAEESWVKEFAQMNQVSSDNENKKLARDKVSKIIQEVSRTIQTIDGTDLTAEELQTISRRLAVGVAQADNNLEYDLADAESLIQAANQYLAGVLAKHYEELTRNQTLTIRLARKDDLWTVTTASGFFFREEPHRFQQLAEDSLDFATQFQGLRLVFAIADETDPAAPRTSNFDRILRSIFNQPPQEFLKMEITGLMPPFCEALYYVPLTINQDQIHTIGGTPKTDGWEKVFANLPTIARLTGRNGRRV